MSPKYMRSAKLSPFMSSTVISDGIELFMNGCCQFAPESRHAGAPQQIAGAELQHVDAIAHAIRGVRVVLLRGVVSGAEDDHEFLRIGLRGGVTLTRVITGADQAWPSIGSSALVFFHRNRGAVRLRDVERVVGRTAAAEAEHGVHLVAVGWLDDAVTVDVVLEDAHVAVEAVVAAAGHGIALQRVRAAASFRSE